MISPSLIQLYQSSTVNTNTDETNAPTRRTEVDFDDDQSSDDDWIRGGLVDLDLDRQAKRQGSAATVGPDNVIVYDTTLRGM